MIALNDDDAAGDGQVVEGRAQGGEVLHQP
jgi:hypothetical protein